MKLFDGRSPIIEPEDNPAVVYKALRTGPDLIDPKRETLLGAITGTSAIELKLHFGITGDPDAELRVATPDADALLGRLTLSQLEEILTAYGNKILEEGEEPNQNIVAVDGLLRKIDELRPTPS